jgi:hypothetical protein
VQIDSPTAYGGRGFCTGRMYNRNGEVALFQFLIVFLFLFLFLILTPLRGSLSDGQQSENIIDIFIF